MISSLYRGYQVAKYISLEIIFCNLYRGVTLRSLNLIVMLNKYGKFEVSSAITEIILLNVPYCNVIS